MIESPEQLHRAFQEAFNRHDLESIVALYEPGAMHPSIDVQTLSVNLAGSLAMLHGKWMLQETGPDGSQVRREGRNTETARQQPDGRWLFVIDNPSVPQD